MRPEMCSREDSNLHGLPHTILSRMRLPVPPREQSKRDKIAPCAPTVKQKITEIFAFFPSQGRTIQN